MAPTALVNKLEPAELCSPIPNRQSTIQQSSSKCDVLIVGAGPSGLMLAQALGRLGIHVRVVERRVLGSQYGNADGLQPRTLEIWKSYGILNQIRAKGACMRAMEAYETSKDGSNLIRLPPSYNVVVPCRYQYEITASITDIEGTLREKAEESGVQITQPCWPTSLDVTDDNESVSTVKLYPVKITLEHPGKSYCARHPKNEQLRIGNGMRNPPNGCTCDGKQDLPHVEVVHAKYVVGADGASSWVRRTLGIDMEGEQTEDVWGVVDVFFETDLPDYRFKCVIQAVSGAIIIIPREGDKIRLYVQLSTSDFPRDMNGKLDRSSLQEDEIRSIILSRIRVGLFPFKIKFTHVFWHTVFSISYFADGLRMQGMLTSSILAAQKVAATFSYNNRVFIVGDACHTHSPKAGQGANASMGDSHNLAWKLAYVLRGWADPSILHTYEIERRAYAQGLIYFDHEISQSLEGCPAAEYQRLLHKQNMFTSGMGITYAQSPLTSQPAVHFGNIVPGERVLPSPITCLGDWVGLNVHDLLISDGLFKLLVFPGNMLLPQTKSSLQIFAKAISESFRASSSSTRVQFHTILRNKKEDVIWTDVPSSIAKSWRCCFAIRDINEDIYEKFGIHEQTSGVLLLVRPDGYISMVSKMTPDNGYKVANYVSSL